MSAALRLPLLGARRAALETCGYCPKLCRAACPVSNAEPRETITPWGKMSLAWYAERGLVPSDAEHADVAWACTACFGCRERCDHRNPVAETLTAARADFFQAGAAPSAARLVAEKHAARMAEVETALRRLPASTETAPTALLIGCAYLRHLPEEARAIAKLSGALAGPIRMLGGCCGLPLLLAGDRPGFERAHRAVSDSLGSSRLIVADPGCALSLSDLGARTLIELAHAKLLLFRTTSQKGPVRWHDPCQLGRGLGQYDAPRTLLSRLLGRPPEEFARRRAHAACSGAGGILPATMPGVSRAIADDRVSEHARLGGGLLVTACASSVRRLRATGADVADLSTLLAAALAGRES